MGSIYGGDVVQICILGIFYVTVNTGKRIFTSVIEAGWDIFGTFPLISTTQRHLNITNHKDWPSQL